jgi:GTP-binding protein
VFGAHPRGDGSDPATPLVVHYDGRLDGTLGDPDLDARLVEAARDALAHGVSRTIELGGRQLFVESYPVRPRLVVVGAVEVSRTLVRLAKELGYETVVIDVDEEYSGTVVEKMANRKGEMTDLRPSGGGKTRITFSAPSRGLIGYHGEFLSDTRGTGIMNRLFEKYGPYKGNIEGRKNGVLISNGSGEANAYALGPLEERGIMMVAPGEQLYEGMIIGENAKTDDLEVNPMKAKQLTNFRASGGKDDAIRLTPPRRLTLEQAIAYIDDDELVEVTPKNIRLRKRYLDPHERKRASRAKQAA